MPHGPELLRHKRVVVLPDVFIDALAPLPPWAEAARRLDEIAGRGGGNLPVGPVRFKLGGNAANLGVALARLGARVDLVAATDDLGMAMLRRVATAVPLGLERVRVGPSASATLGLECEDANIMLSHAGPLADLGPEALEPADWELMEEADAVAVVNWAQNRRGTELASAVFQRVGARCFTYLDTGDPRHRADAAGLLGEKGVWEGLSAWGLNENEAHAFAGEGAADVVDAAQGLACRLGTRLDLHTAELAASVTAEERTVVPSVPAQVRRRTGAGDAWNAGNLAGHLLGWGADARLGLAHRVAARYVEGSGLPPAWDEVAAPPGLRSP